MRNDSLIGKVHNMFYRYEFQGAGSRGNKPHVHIGVTFKPELKGISSARIACMSTSLASSLYGADFDNLLKLGDVSDKEEYHEWCKVFSCVNIHDCEKCEHRCMKATNAQGEKVCRYRKQPSPSWGVMGLWLENIEVDYTLEVYELLEEMGLASRNLDPRSNRWTLHESLTAGKWHYPGDRREFLIVSIPLLSAITRSPTNVNMCDRHFQVTFDYSIEFSFYIASLFAYVSLSSILLTSLSLFVFHCYYYIVQHCWLLLIFLIFCSSFIQFLKSCLSLPDGYG